MNGTNALNVSGTGNTLSLTGGVTGNTSVLSVDVSDSNTLGLNSGTGDKLVSLTTLTLGSSGGTNTFLNMDVGDQVTPVITSTPIRLVW